MEGGVDEGVCCDKRSVCEPRACGSVSHLKADYYNYYCAGATCVGGAPDQTECCDARAQCEASVCTEWRGLKSGYQALLCAEATCLVGGADETTCCNARWPEPDFVAYQGVDLPPSTTVFPWTAPNIDAIRVDQEFSFAFAESVRLVDAFSDVVGISIVDTSTSEACAVVLERFNVPHLPVFLQKCHKQICVLFIACRISCLSSILFKVLLRRPTTFARIPISSAKTFQILDMLNKPAETPEQPEPEVLLQGRANWKWVCASVNRIPSFVSDCIQLNDSHASEQLPADVFLLCSL